MKTKSQLLEKFNDPDFVVRLQAGEHSAFGELRDELFPWLIAFAVKKYRLTEEEAKDLVQDLAVVLIDKIQTFDPSPRRFVAWMFQILRNRCIDELRKRRKFRLTSLEAIPENFAGRNSKINMRGFIMAKRKKHDLKAFEEYLRHLYKTSEPQPFTTEEIELLLKSCVKPKDLAKYRNEKLVDLMQEAHLRKQARAEACFRDPSQVHSFGELLNSILVIKRIFISQLAQELDMTAEEIEDYIENRLPPRSLYEDQMQKLAALTGIALEEIRRIAGETAKAAGTKTPAAVEATPSRKPQRPYPMPSGYSSVGMIREEESSNYKKR